MADLQLSLLGTFQASRNFVPIRHQAWRHPLAQRLLKLVLVRRPEPLSIAEAAQRLGGVAPAQVIAAAVQANAVLAPGASLVVEGAQLHFLAGPGCWIDLDELLAHYQAGLDAAARGLMLPAVLALQEADALYQGALLDELQEPWVMPLRERLEAIYTDILDRLAEGHGVLGRYQDAVGFCHKALIHDPVRESTYQRMMVYYYYLGDLSGAQEAYEACQQAMESAGRPVSGESTRLLESLLQGGALR